MTTKTKTPEAALAPVAEVDDSLAAAAAAEQSLETTDQIPDFIEKGNREGADQIAVEDARIPRLVLAQAQTPQAMRGDAAYIEGLQAGMAFNDLTNVIYGEIPLDVIVVRADKPRWVEFDEDDRSVIDPSVPPGDPRTLFTTDEKGKRVRPKATMFYDYVVLLGAQLEPLALSFKSSAIKYSARPLNGLIKMKPVPIYACKYRLTPRLMKNDEGTWYVFIPTQIGVLKNKETHDKAKAHFQNFRTKDVAFDQAHPAADVPEDTSGI